MIVISAPCFNNTISVSRSPNSDASCAGVEPLLSLTLIEDFSGRFSMRNSSKSGKPSAIM